MRENFIEFNLNEFNAQILLKSCRQNSCWFTNIRFGTANIIALGNQPCFYKYSTTTKNCAISSLSFIKASRYTYLQHKDLKLKIFQRIK